MRKCPECLRWTWIAAFSLLLFSCGGGGSAGGASPAPGLSITAQPANAAVSEGQTATFTITATGSGPLTYQWQKDGVQLGGARSPGYTSPATTLADSGSLFRVVVTDLSGASVTSLPASLTVSVGVRPTQHYVDPLNGSDQGDGSSAHPWRSLQDVLDHQVETRTWESLPYAEGKQLVPVNAGAPVRAGDTIWLRSGYYGPLTVQSAYNVAPVTLAAEGGHEPRFDSMLVQSSRHWILRGFSVSPSYSAVYSPNTMVTVEDHNWRGPASDIVIDGFQIFSVPDEAVWTTQLDWDEQAANGFYASGDRVTIRDCRIRNSNFGLSLTGQGSRAERNTIDGFCGDGLRGLGDDEVFEYNTVKNRRDVNDNHPDGFQSWSLGSDGRVGTGVVRNITLRGNVFLAYEDPNLPFAGTIQGIGCFDGTFENWVVENNVVITDHWHGISFYGARNVRIVNNTVLDLNAGTEGTPWILVTAHKNGTPSTDCVVRNNLTTKLNVSADLDHHLEVDHNLVIPVDPTGYFVDVANHDLRLAVASPALDQGSPALAPVLDADGHPRPQGAGCDVGAYERTP